MKKLSVLLIIFIILTYFLLTYSFSKFLLFFRNDIKNENLGLKKYCNEHICVYTKYSIEELEDIPIINHFDKEEIKKYNLSFIFIDPEARGNFSATLINLLIYLKKQKNVFAICKYYSPGCMMYTNSSIMDRYIWIFYDNQSSLVDTDKLLLIFIEDNKNSGIEIYKNRIFLYGNNETIIKVLDKFLLYWYDFINN
ncbi:MAG: hypothetical protein QW038_00210 [Nanopusillaceae archaeon]